MKSKEKQKKVLEYPIRKMKQLGKTVILSIKGNIFTKKNKPYITLILLALLVNDIFLSKESSDSTFYGVTIIFLITALFYKLKSRFTFIICLILVVLMFINFIFSGTTGPSKEAEKIAVWVFLLMIAGIIQQLRE